MQNNAITTVGQTNEPPFSGWWEEDRQLTQKFYNEALGCHGAAPMFAETWIVERILQQHLACSSMLSVFALQDLFAIEEKLRVADPSSERINIPYVSAM